MSVGLEETQPASRESERWPARIGKYEIERELGAGGNGIVLLARDPALDRKVAIKILRRGDDDTARQRLVREARAVAALAHDNIIVVHEVGTVDDQVFVAMEYVAGGTLATWQRSKGWRERVAAYVRAGRGLAAAHKAGLVHRDFKPDNVLVGDGRVRVTDFGLVSASETKAGGRAAVTISLTQTGTVMGTPRYMAPEQHLGEKVDARADQFAFCVALFEAVYGCPPFAGDTYAELGDNVLAGKLVDTPPSRVPHAVRDAIVRGLAREPDDRFASIEELLAALERAAATRSARRWLVAGLVVAIAATAGGIAWVAREPAASPPPPPDAQQGPTVEETWTAGQLAYNRGDYAEAVRQFKHALDMQPEVASWKPAYLWDLAQSYRQMGDCKNALAAYKMYQGLDPKNKTEFVQGLIRDLEECVRQKQAQ